MQGGIKRKSFPSFSRKGVISASNTRPESVLRAQQQLAFPLCLSLCELGEEIELVSGEPGLGAVLGVTVCSCFPRRLLGVPEPRFSVGSVVSRAGPGSARAVLAGNVLGATHGWMEGEGRQGTLQNHIHPLWKAAPILCVIVIPPHTVKVRPSHGREAGTEISAWPRRAWNPNELQQGGDAINKTSSVTN